MATLATQVVTRLGITPSFAAAAVGGDQFTPSANTFIELKNVGGGSITVTAAPTKVPAANLTTTMAAVTVALTTGDKMIGPFPSELFADANGFCQLTYSGVTSLTIGVFQLSQP